MKEKSLFFFLLLICFFSPLGLSSITLQENQYVKIVNAHLRIKDFQSAREDAVQALHLFPHSKPLWEVYIKVLSKQGREKEMISTWNEYVNVFPEEKENRILIETLAWGIVEHGSHSTSPIIRLLALLSAFLSQDSKGVEIVARNLKDHNSAIRALAVQLSANLNDAEIQEGIYKLFKEETVWNVRLEVIRSIGMMKLKDAQNDLLSLLQSANTTAEETAAVIEALVELWDSPSRKEAARLTQSGRAGLRILGCQVMAHFEMRENIDLLIPLIEDHNADVRKAALWTLGYLRVQEINGQPIVDIIQKRLNDTDPIVGLKAAWIVTLIDPAKGQKALQSFFTHADSDVRIMAAAHLAACGKYAFPLIIEQFKTSSEPFVRMNLALGLLGQNLHTDEACKTLYQGLQNVKERWNWDEKHHVRALVPSKLKHLDDLNTSPETIDQMTRLEILNILSIMKFSHAQQAIKSFLQEKTWGITVTAAVTLLTEGDEATLELVENLMKDNDMQVRVQAALILALWGGGELALETLYTAYPQVDREMKERILEGIIKISSPKSIPFLLERLKEPNQSLRVIAATGLILCLYH